MKYLVVIESGPTSFGAYVPDLPGCLADGRTQAEAIANAQVIITEWLETAQELRRPIPAPRPHLRIAS